MILYADEKFVSMKPACGVQENIKLKATHLETLLLRCLFVLAVIVFFSSCSKQREQNAQNCMLASL